MTILVSLSRVENFLKVVKQAILFNRDLRLEGEEEEKISNLLLSEKITGAIESNLHHSLDISEED